MLSLEEAQARLLAHARPTGEERVALADAAGRVLADPRIVAAVDVPPFANSVDGRLRVARRRCARRPPRRRRDRCRRGIPPVGRGRDGGPDHDRRAAAPRSGLRGPDRGRRGVRRRRLRAVAGHARRVRPLGRARHPCRRRGPAGRAAVTGQAGRPRLPGHRRGRGPQASGCRDPVDRRRARRPG